MRRHMVVMNYGKINSQDRIRRLESLSGWNWIPFADQWEEGFNHLQSFATEHGTANVPARYAAVDGFRLGNWLAVQRQKNAKNLLSDEQVKRIVALGGLTWDPVEEHWEEGFRQLQAFVTEHGHANVPPKYVSPDGCKLRVWVQRQRNNKSGELLSGDRADRLEALPGWVWDILPDQWEVGFHHLQAYVAQHGNARIPAKHSTREGYKLGNWVATQRQNKVKNLLNDDRAKRLETLQGWAWDQWAEGFRQLQLFVNEHGNTNVPKGYVSADGYRLNGWVQRQRNNKSNSLLGKDQVERLEALPGWVWKVR